MCIRIPVEVSSVFSPFFCLYLYCVVFPVFLIFVRRFSLVGKVLKLGILVDDVWVVCYYLFLGGLLSLSFSDFLGEWCALVFGRVVCSGFCVVLTVVFGSSVSRLYSFFFRTLALLGAVAPYTYTVLAVLLLRNIH